MTESAQHMPRSRILLEMLWVLGPAALVYMIGILTDNTGLGLVSIVAAWLVIRELLRRRGKGWGTYGLRRPARWRKTLTIILGGVVLLHVLIRIMKPFLSEYVTGEPLDLSRFESLRGDPLVLILGLLIVWTIAAFGEEMVFRGYMLNRTSRMLSSTGKSGWGGAVVLSSVVFGLGHIYQGWTGVILSAIAGVVYCAAYFLDGRCLWAPILIHGIYDTSVFLALFLGLENKLPGLG